MKMADGCISCATVSGACVPPGGVVFENSNWMVALQAKPLRFPCLPFIILKRHCENMAGLDVEESSSLGQLMQLTAQALDDVLHPAKVHFGIYAESVKHLHVHVFPRMPDMPAGNIPNVWIGQWNYLLHVLGLKKAYPDEVVAQYAEKLRGAYLKLESSQ
ncbi:MAG: HIT family protein [Chloroflexi bacterium]|nr:MAG: HIT family protein [Chloroflexota bacterium]RPI96816.1 MAG: HIT family protein [Chloroflexota bacterium]